MSSRYIYCDQLDDLGMFRLEGYVHLNAIMAVLCFIQRSSSQNYPLIVKVARFVVFLNKIYHHLMSF